jgi:SAM-dependent methyltransferase
VSVDREAAQFYATDAARRSRASLATKEREWNDRGLLDRVVREYRELGGADGGILLDFGGGNGGTAVLLGGRFGARRKICYDVAEPSERLPGVEYVIGSGSELATELGGGTVDVLVAEEVIEHLFDTDAMLELCHKLLKPRGLLLLTTPNLSSAVNRLALLLGRQPGGTEISTVFRPGEAGAATTPLAGHIRVFTFGAIQEFLRFHGFVVERAFTVPGAPGDGAPTGRDDTHRLDRFVDRVASRFSPSLGARTIVFARAPDAA